MEPEGLAFGLCGVRAAPVRSLTNADQNEILNILGFVGAIREPSRGSYA